MASYSSGESYKQHSPSKASVLGELKEAKRTITFQDEAITLQLGEYDGDQDQEAMEANNQGQEEVEAQVVNAQGVNSPPHRLTRSTFKELGNSGRLFSLLIVSCVIKGA